MKINMLCSLQNLSACLIMTSSTMFITRFMSLSPFYFGVILSILLLFCYLSIRCDKARLKISLNCFILILVSYIYILYIILNSLINGISLKYPMLISFSIIMYFVSKFLYKKIDIKYVYFFVNMFIFFNFFLLSFDLIYRILHPRILPWEYTSKDFFYMFKFSSIIFNDTNEVGFMALIILTFMYSLNKVGITKIKRMYFCLFFALLFFTFSRAAILGFLVLFFIYSIRENIKITVLIPLGLLFLIVIFIFFLSFSTEDISDVSLKSKFDIFFKTFDYLRTVDIKTFLFGIGYEKSPTVLGIYGHNYISLYIIEFGFVGLLLLLSLFFSIFMECNNNKFFLIVYFITGLSYVPYFIPYFYILMGILSGLTDNKKEI